MNAECFLDTNILVYAIDQTPENDRKHQIARDLIQTKEFGLSAQVLQEFYVVATRKLQVPMPASEAAEFIEKLRVFPIIPVDHGLVTEGIRNSVKHQLSFWDGAIIAAAERIGAPLLYSEDLSHGQTFGEVTVVNPFKIPD